MVSRMVRDSSVALRRQRTPKDYQNKLDGDAKSRQIEDPVHSLGLSTIHGGKKKAGKGREPDEYFVQMETKKKDDVDLGKKGNRPSWKGKDAALVLLGPGLSNSPQPLRRCKVEIGDSDNDREYAPALACNLVRDAGSRNKKKLNDRRLEDVRC